MELCGIIYKCKEKLPPSKIIFGPDFSFDDDFYNAKADHLRISIQTWNEKDMSNPSKK